MYINTVVYNCCAILITKPMQFRRWPPGALFFVHTRVKGSEKEKIKTSFSKTAHLIRSMHKTPGRCCRWRLHQAWLLPQKVSSIFRIFQGVLTLHSLAVFLTLLTLSHDLTLICVSRRVPWPATNNMQIIYKTSVFSRAPLKDSWLY